MPAELSVSRYQFAAMVAGMAPAVATLCFRAEVGKRLPSAVTSQRVTNHAVRDEATSDSAQFVGVRASARLARTGFPQAPRDGGVDIQIDLLDDPILCDDERRWRRQQPHVIAVDAFEVDAASQIGLADRVGQRKDEPAFHAEHVVDIGQNIEVDAALRFDARTTAGGVRRYGDN